MMVLVLVSFVLGLISFAELYSHALNVFYALVKPLIYKGLLSFS